MKTKFVHMIWALALALAIYFIIIAIKEKPEGDTLIVQLPPASISSMKCTVAKFMLNNVDTTRQIAPLFENLGNHHFQISTKNNLAQTFFDQGLKLAYAFNHAEAHRSFMEAVRLDPRSAMAYWGQAYVLGPNINDPFPDDDRKTKSYEAIMKAKNLMGTSSPLEKALIEAMSHRYSADLSADISGLNRAYMTAMAEVAKKFPRDAEVQTLYAEAVMNTMPWNYWDKNGDPNPNTIMGKTALENAMQANPDHPGAHHYYIHMMELPKPDLAVPSADKLGALMPAAGHLVHMPSHIYIRVGRYLDAVNSNRTAILADEDYISQCYSQGMYPLVYYPHNLHFLWSSASLLGDSKTAIDAAKKTAEKVPIGEMAGLHFLQDFASTPLLAFTRFGKWNEILTAPYPGDDYPHLKLIWHYARGIAFVRKDNLKEAKEELDALNKLQNDPALESIMGNFNNSSSIIAKVAHEVVAGEIAAAEGEYEKAIAHLNMAVNFEDDLVYSEPSAWHIPVRQTLGAVFLKSKKYSDAELCFKEDLKELRQNGWSLMGLYQSLIAQDKLQEATEIKKEFDAAWEYADLEINNSIL